MYTVTVNPKATAATIARADSKSEAQRANFELEHFGTYGNNEVWVLHNTKTNGHYFIETFHPDHRCITCTCEEYKDSSYCKHASRILEEMHLRIQCEIYEAIDVEFTPGAGKY